MRHSRSRIDRRSMSIVFQRFYKTNFLTATLKLYDSFLINVFVPLKRKAKQPIL